MTTPPRSPYGPADSGAYTPPQQPPLHSPAQPQSAAWFHAQEQVPDGYSPVGPTLSKRTNGPGLAALIIGIAALITVFLPFAGLLGTAGVIVGIIGLALADRPRRAAAWGTALSAVALTIPAVMIVIYIVGLFVGASGPDA